MTPIYRSPDRGLTSAIRSLLQDHNIQSSIIESRKSNNPFGSSSVTWYELWLRHFADANRAKSIITQHEFSTFKTNMASRGTLVEQSRQDAGRQADFSQARIMHPSPDELPIKTAHGVEHEAIATPPPRAQQPVFSSHPPDAVEQRRREDLIPINNKRVFKRLGLLLGFSEEEIEKLDSNKLYRPWDANTLMERVRNLKQKCS